MADLYSAKNHLINRLGDKATNYWALLKSWYKRKISKEEFDAKAKALLGEDNVALHNKFLFAILIKCQTGEIPPDAQPVRQSISPMESSPLEPPALKRPRPTTMPAEVIKPIKPKILLATEIPYGSLEPTKHYAPPKVQVFKDLDSMLLCSHERALPTVSTLHARVLLLAWEAGLDDASEECAELILESLKMFLKNIMQVIISHRTNWKKDGLSFQHSFGNGGSNVRPPTELEPRVYSILEQYTAVQQSEALSISKLSSKTTGSECVTLFHMRDALMAKPQCIPVHYIYSATMERVLSKMWHPSNEEEAQARVVHDWELSKLKPNPFTISS